MKMKQPKVICKDCKYFAFVHDHDLEGYSRYECCCTNENYQPQPYISPVTGKTVTPRSIYVWCDQANKDGSCPYWEQRGDEPVEVLNEGCDLNKLEMGGCLIMILSVVISFIAIGLEDSKKSSGGMFAIGAFICLILGSYLMFKGSNYHKDEDDDE